MSCRSAWHARSPTPVRASPAGARVSKLGATLPAFLDQLAGPERVGARLEEHLDRGRLGRGLRSQVIGLDDRRPPHGHGTSCSTKWTADARGLMGTRGATRKPSTLIRGTTVMPGAIRATATPPPMEPEAGTDDRASGSVARCRSFSPLMSYSVPNARAHRHHQTPAADRRGWRRAPDDGTACWRVRSAGRCSRRSGRARCRR